MPSSDTLKKYVGTAGDALALIWQRLRGTDTTETRPPIGAKDQYPAGGAAAPIAGISTGTLLMIGALWYLMRGKRGG